MNPHPHRPTPALPAGLPFHALVVLPHDGDDMAGPVRMSSAGEMAQVMARIGGHVTLETPNLLVTGGDPIRDRIAVADPSVFTPAGLAGAVSLFGRGVALRDALARAAEAGQQLDDVLAAYADLTAVTAAARAARHGAPRSSKSGSEPPPRPHGDDSDGDLDTLLGLVDDPAAGPAPNDGARLVQSFLRRGAQPSARSARRDAHPVAAVEAVLSQQIAALLQTPALRAAETFWRGLRLLVDATDFRAEHRISVVRLPRTRMAEELPRLDPGEAPYSAILVDAELDGSARDIAWLTDVAKAAEMVRAPAVLGLSPRFFGVDILPAELPYPRTVLDGAAYDAWRAFRAKPESRWTALAVNRPLLRTTHDGARRNALGLSEPIADRRNLCWGNAAWIVACAMARSAARTGWPTELTGQGESATPDLPVAPWNATDPDSPQIPLETLLDAQTCRDLADSGIVPIACRRNRDTAFVALAPLAHKPEVYGDAAMTGISRGMTQLAYQLGATQLLNEVAELIARTGTIDPAAAERLRAALHHRLGEGSQVRTALQPDSDTAGGHVLSLDIQLDRAIAGGARYGFTLAV
jgi:type VI secretion system protein ImpC